MSAPTSHVPRSPDCREGKHAACVGDAWDEDLDDLVECWCSCHDDTAGEP